MSVPDSVISSVRSGNNDHENNPIKYLFNKFKHSFPTIQWFYTSTTEIEKCG